MSSWLYTSVMHVCTAEDGCSLFASPQIKMEGRISLNAWVCAMVIGKAEKICHCTQAHLLLQYNHNTPMGLWVNLLVFILVFHVRAPIPIQANQLLTHFPANMSIKIVKYDLRTRILLPYWTTQVTHASWLCLDQTYLRCDCGFWNSGSKTLDCSYICLVPALTYPLFGVSSGHINVSFSKQIYIFIIFDNLYIFY